MLNVCDNIGFSLFIEISNIIKYQVLNWFKYSYSDEYYLAPGPVFLRHAKCARHGRSIFHTVDNIYETS